ncbi:hypothetical protein C2S51_011607 [Perilla frutescens var. frutescens]|nr:hypothetical protein C2S51_011607 [Perilla frutescens var. frutescens]
MGIIILLKFALLCVDLLAWCVPYFAPVIALGYPLVASIRAIETGSNYLMKKLVIYWTLFSLFSLFEFAFAKIIEWIPIWSSVRLLVILWLVMPQFDGAYHAYQGLVRPVLLVKLQAFIERLLKEERLCKRETFLDVVEKYIKENGPEVLEKLIALEHESQKSINFQRDTKILEPEGKNTAATSKQLNEPKAAQHDAEMLEATEKSAATKTQRVQYPQSISSAWVLKDMTPPEASVENRRPETPPHKKTQQDWTCDICNVETMTEIMLNAHLQGSHHKSKLDSLKARMLDAKDTEPSPLVQHMQSVSAGWDLKGTYATVEVKEIIPPKEAAEKRYPETPPLKKAQQDWTCGLCKVTTTREMDLKAHLHGSKHKFMLATLKANKLGAKDSAPSPSVTSKLNHVSKNEREGCNSSHRDIRVVDSAEKNGSATSQKVQVQNTQSIKAVWVPKGKGANAEVKEMTPPEASAQSSCVETPPLKKGQQEWTFDSCKETVPSEKTSNAHLQGKFESLKPSELPSKDTVLSPSATCKANQGNLVGTWIKYGEGSVKKSSKPETFKHWCIVCDVKLISDVDLASHLNGKRHSSNIEEIKRCEALIS